mmetsp:Transcript_12796/g.19264  ORF Transcript_12796/g.19264 Transcript_12796/m.19264 type:complete len:177 (+) Transcript_12796:23-553(+)
MGRRKIPMALIPVKSARNTTFKKRKSGLFKKAMELSILTGARIRVIIYDENKLHEYGSEEDPKPLLRRYHTTSHIPHEKYSNEDYEWLTENNGTVAIQESKRGTEEDEREARELLNMMEGHQQTYTIPITNDNRNNITRTTTITNNNNNMGLPLIPGMMPINMLNIQQMIKQQQEK